MSTRFAGLLTARGSVRLDGRRVWLNATVFEDSLIETSVVGARITLESGAEILLAPDSRLRFAPSFLILEQGSCQARNLHDFPLRAANLVIEGNVAFAGPNAIQIPELLKTQKELPPLSQRP